MQDFLLLMEYYAITVLNVYLTTTSPNTFELIPKMTWCHVVLSQ